MNGRGQRLGIIALAATPLVLGAVIAGVLFALGERRMLQLSVAIPALFAGTGVVLTVIITIVLVLRSRRHRAASRLTTAHAEGVAEGTAQERENHRRFLARLDHELKNPLTAIRAISAAADDNSAGWRTVDAQAAKLSTLVRDLRKLAELETRTPERESVDLELMLNEAIEAVRQQHPLAADRITFTVTRVPWPVPTVSADLDLLSLAVDNVLGNAVKYSSAGPIEVRLREEDGWAIIEVADAGRGIPAPDLSLVFDELARAQNARDVSGSGLGLTLVAIALARHGGDVALRSVEDSGTVAVLRVPLAS